MGQYLDIVRRFEKEHLDSHKSTITDTNGRFHTASIAQCHQCHGTNWGPTGTSLTEILPSGEEVEVETWNCTGCVSCLEETRPPLAPEAIPPEAIPSTCPQCDKRYRLFVEASPHIPGEPDQPVLICSKCGHSEQVCPECQCTNVLTDKMGMYCVDCRKRPGQPDPPPASRTDPTPLPSRRYSLGATPPTSDCSSCGRHNWREGIYSWACRHCQYTEMKS